MTTMGIVYGHFAERNMMLKKIRHYLIMLWRITLQYSKLLGHAWQIMWCYVGWHGLGQLISFVHSNTIKKICIKDHGDGLKGLKSFSLTIAKDWVSHNLTLKMPKWFKLVKICMVQVCKVYKKQMMIQHHFFYENQCVCVINWTQIWICVKMFEHNFFTLENF
jgi:hypothetical protein